MKIVVASSGRAHLLDCARELSKQGHDVTFYACTPRKNLIKYGFPEGKSLLWFMAPFYALKTYLPSELTRQLYMEALDFIVYWIIPQCDIFIAQSPNYSRCMLKAKKKYGATCILDRGSSHIRTFNRLGRLCEQTHENQRYIRIDERQYSYADYVAIASSFVERSFIENGFDKNKLFINPYGVSLQHFYPTQYTGEFDCIVVGGWNKRKGSKIVIDAFENTAIRVLHVGGLGDLPFPEADNFVHIDPVSEDMLVNYYAKAKVFIFPSYDDGFGLVLCQAAACGLPIVCSQNTGGPTLKKMLGDENNIYVMKEINAESLRKGVYQQLVTCKHEGVRNYVGNKMALFTWDAYGKRYDKFLKSMIR